MNALLIFSRPLVCRRQLSVQAGRVVTREAWWEKAGPSNFKAVNSVEELLHEMVRSLRLRFPVPCSVQALVFSTSSTGLVVSGLYPR